MPTTVLLEVVHARRLGPAPQSANGYNAVLVRQVDDNRRHPCKTHHINMQDRDAQPGRHSGIYGIATLIQNALPGQRGQIMPRSDHPLGAHNGRTIRSSNWQLTHLSPLLIRMYRYRPTPPNWVLRTAIGPASMAGQLAVRST